MAAKKASWKTVNDNRHYLNVYKEMPLSSENSLLRIMEVSENKMKLLELKDDAEKDRWQKCLLSDKPFVLIIR